LLAAPSRIIVLGAGAIGASTGALLFETGVPCLLVGRDEQVRAIGERGVDLRLPHAARSVRVPAVASLAEAAPTRDDLVLLATMGHDTARALASLDPGVTVASFQNGVAPLDAIAARGHPTLAAVVYVPAERRGPGVVALPGVPFVGTVIVGGWPSGEGAWAQWLVARLVHAGYRAEHEPDVAPWVRAKLLVNLGGIVVALCNAPPAEVIAAAQEEARAVWRSAREPFVDIAALTARVGPLETAPVDDRERVGGSTRSALARGDRLETACLHGTIVEAGRACGVATPVNDALVLLAEQAWQEQWAAGSMNEDELRARVFG
jgi:2-dehydropantoate 2-reductase